MSTPETKNKLGFLSLPLFRDLLLITLIIVVAWKLLNAELKIDLASFSFNDFLALVLALFSVALSVAFYFKANDASNQFYDNTYRFTKEMSEILGRIEAGFGERLRHLDEGYNGMRDRLDKLPYYGGPTVSDVKKEEEEIRRKEEEQRSVIEDLAKRAKLAEHEKQALFANLAKVSQELENARLELRQMQAGRHESAADAPQRRFILRYVAKMMAQRNPELSSRRLITGTQLRNLFDTIKSELADAALDDMRKLGLLDESGNPTEDTLMILRGEIRRF
jgi:hypothetical protein